MKYKIHITHGKYMFSFKIEMFQRVHLFWFSWWESVNIRHGSRSNIAEYCRDWKKEFDIKDENIFDLTK